ncbi:MAG: hypothetical protein QNK37_04730 [Acidobacteriota bacterium]|nr:hypothetical protein [Acidobacteriota bacterium]
MHSALAELKTRADIFLARAKDGDPSTLKRLAALPAFKGLAPEAVQNQLSRKHALSLIAGEFGFRSWPQAKEILAGEKPGEDFGSMLHSDRDSTGFLNNWYADYEEARTCREQIDSYLLAYGKQFFVVSAEYIRSLGLSPDDPAWEEMGRDWARPKSLAARTRLYAQLVSKREPEGAGI